MSQLSRYCKAYPTKTFHQFAGWTSAKNSSADVLFLHDNFVVTENVFNDRDVIFDAVTDEWKEFCTSTLQFDPDPHKLQEKTAAKQAA